MRKTLGLLLLVCSSVLWAQQYDLVIEGGRVMDPETRLDAVRNVGISAGKIERISAAPLSGKRVLSARGLVVVPGFIDLHQHGQELASQKVKALDGVTTALEMEIGVPDVEKFLREKGGRSIIHYGTTASHLAARAAAFGVSLPEDEILPNSGPATNQPATAEQLTSIKSRLNQQLDAGALGVGFGIQYAPGTTHSEIIQMFRLATERSVPVFTHIRSFGRIEPGSAIEAVSEVIGAAAVTGASLHIVHINSSCGKDGLECLAMVAGARARGLDVTTEAYPYTAGMTSITSALFNPGWKEKLGTDYSNLVLPGTGDHLTKERFEELHNSSRAQEVLLFSNTEETVDSIITQPLTIIASDGGPGHPRNAGTYAKVLSRYVRQQGTLTLMDALRKMSLMPAQRLERATPAARRKGRLQEGADADIVVFDAATIEDRSTYQSAMEPSIGMKYVLVGGTPVVDEGKLVPDVYPGHALLGPGRQ
jgi:N-acyl-D-aspartate/D-glutamate deacylase